jgi:hypothetical protein
MSAFLKDISTQSIISNALFNMSFIHTVLHYTKEPTKIADNYPIIGKKDSVWAAYRKHLFFHLLVVVKVFFRSVLTVYVTFLVMVAIKVAVVDLTHAALQEDNVRKGHKVKDTQTKTKEKHSDISIADIHDLMTRSLWKDDGLFRLLQMLLAQGLTAVIVATFVSDPGSMNVVSHRLINVKIFMGSMMIVQMLVVAAIYL